MSEQTKLELEILNGPLDGYSVLLEIKTEWTRQPGGLLSFPWDEELGEPQMLFVPGEQGWQAEPVKAKRGTHLLRPETEDHLPAVLQTDDIIKASNTWLKVKSISD